MHVHTHVLMHTHSQTQAYRCIHTYIHTCAHTCIHTYMYTCVYTYKLAYAYTVMYLCIYTGLPRWFSSKESTCQRSRYRRHRFNPFGWEDLLEEEIITHSSILAWRIPWTEEPGGLQSMGYKSGTHAQTHSSEHCLPKCLLPTAAPGNP